jgi:hypothetical protein
MKRIIKVIFILVLSIFISLQVVAQDREGLDERVKRLQETVTELRGLEFKKDIKAGAITRNKIKKFMLREIAWEYPEEKIQVFQKIAEEWGFLKKNEDYMKLFIRLITSSVAGFYHQRTKKIYFPQGWQFDEGTIAHELTHAAQDQHFDLNSLPSEDNGCDNDDLILAVHCIIEGDATVLGHKHGMGAQFDARKRQIGDFRMAKAGMARMGRYPDYIVDNLLFPYTYGFNFVLKALEKNDDWKDVDKLFEELPLSTEQILHPKKYFDKKDYPTIIKLPVLKDKLGKDWSLLYANVFGEWNIQIMLRQFKTKKAEKASEGWGGDGYALYEDKDGKLLAVWFTNWDTENDAKEFYDAYKNLLKKKYKDAEVKKDEDKKFEMENEKTTIGLEIRDKDVLIIEGAPDGKFDSLMKTIWDGVKKEELKKVERVYVPREY